jgi:hypothetical protein
VEVTVTEPEAEVVEPDEPETGDVTEPDEPTEPPEPEPDEPEALAAVEPEPEQVVDEATFKKVDQAGTTYRNRVAALLGDAILGFSPCPLCADGIMGHIPPLEDAQPSSELQARLLDVLRTPVEPHYLSAPNGRKCETCDGWGVVLTGSRKAGRERAECPICKGNGFVSHGVLAAPQNGDAPPLALVSPEDESPLVVGDADIWGSPKVLPDGQENPNYGKMPQYKNPTLP